MRCTFPQADVLRSVASNGLRRMQRFSALVNMHKHKHLTSSGEKCACKRIPPSRDQQHIRAVLRLMVIPSSVQAHLDGIPEQSFRRSPSSVATPAGRHIALTRICTLAASPAACVHWVLLNAPGAWMHDERHTMRLASTAQVLAKCDLRVRHGSSPQRTRPQSAQRFILNACTGRDDLPSTCHEQ